MRIAYTFEYICRREKRVSDIRKRHDHKREGEKTKRERKREKLERERERKERLPNQAERVRQCHRYGMHRVGVHASKDDTLLNLPLFVFAIEVINTRGCNFVL